MDTGGNINEDLREWLTRAESCLAFKEVCKEVTTVTLAPGNISSTTITNLLECPVCMNSMLYSPIYQCSNGHTICFKCKSRVRNTCPICRKELGNIRCIALEKVAELLELPCKFSVYGCLAMYPYRNRARHEESCRFGFYNCPYAGAECRVVGNVGTLVTHLREDHGVDVHNGSNFSHRYVKSNPLDVENATWMLTIFNCYGCQFCLHFEAFKIQDAPVYMAFMRFMGEKTEARNFSYSLEVGGDGRKMTWQGIPRSIRDGHKTVRDSLDGLIIPRKLALDVFGDGRDLKLKLTGKIWRDPLV